MANYQENTNTSTSTTGGSTQSGTLGFYNTGMQNLLGQGQKAAQTPYQAYGGDLVAGASPLQQQATDLAQSQAGNWQPLQQQAQGALTQLGAAGQFDPNQIAQYMNPYTQNVVSEIGRLGNEQFQNQVLPGLAGNFSSLGQQGSARQAMLMSDAAARNQREVLGQQSTALNTGYNSAMDNYLNWSKLNSGNLQSQGAGMANLAQGTQQMGLADVGSLNTLGQQQQATEQKQLEADYGQFQKQQDYPWQQLNNWGNLFKVGTPQSSVSSNASTNTSTGSGWGTSFKKGGLARFASGGGFFDEAAFQRMIESEGITDPALIARLRGLAQIESSGNPAARGPVVPSGMHRGTQARGMFQIMPSTAREMGVASGADDTELSKAGLQYFLKNNAKFNDLDLATIAHHGGPGAAAKYAATGATASRDRATGLPSNEFLQRVQAASLPYQDARRLGSGRIGGQDLPIQAGQRAGAGMIGGQDMAYRDPSRAAAGPIGGQDLAYRDPGRVSAGVIGAPPAPPVPAELPYKGAQRLSSGVIGGQDIAYRDPSRVSSGVIGARPAPVRPEVPMPNEHPADVADLAYTDAIANAGTQEVSPTIAHDAGVVNAGAPSPAAVDPNAELLQRRLDLAKRINEDPSLQLKSNEGQTMGNIGEALLRASAQGPANLGQIAGRAGTAYYDAEALRERENQARVMARYGLEDKALPEVSRGLLGKTGAGGKRFELKNGPGGMFLFDNLTAKRELVDPKDPYFNSQLFSKFYKEAVDSGHANPEQYASEMVAYTRGNVTGETSTVPKVAAGLPTRGQGQQQQAEGKVAAVPYETLTKDKVKAYKDMDTFDQVDAALRSVETSKVAPPISAVKAWAESLGVPVDVDRLGSEQALKTIVGRMALGLHEPGTGVMTDADLEFFKSITPGLANTPGGNAKILEASRKLAKRRIDIAQLADDYRAQNPKGILDAGWNKYRDAWTKSNPMYPELNKTKQGQTAGGATVINWNTGR